MPSELHTRAVALADAGFLWRVYASTRFDEIAAFGWPPAQQEAFLRMQYRARCQSYAATYPDAENLILVADGIDAGSISIHRKSSEMRLIDIAFLPEYRNKGLGAQAIQGLIREACERSIPLRLSVLRGNPAIRLYLRVGFREISADPMYIEMECHGQPG